MTRRRGWNGAGSGEMSNSKRNRSKRPALLLRRSNNQEVRIEI